MLLILDVAEDAVAVGGDRAGSASPKELMVPSNKRTLSALRVSTRNRVSSATYGTRTASAGFSDATARSGTWPSGWRTSSGSRWLAAPDGYRSSSCRCDGPGRAPDTTKPGGLGVVSGPGLLWCSRQVKHGRACRRPAEVPWGRDVAWVARL